MNCSNCGATTEAVDFIPGVLAECTSCRAIMTEAGTFLDEVVLEPRDIRIDGPTTVDEDEYWEEEHDYETVDPFDADVCDWDDDDY